MTASVPPDREAAERREAAVQQVAVALANVSRLPEWMQIPALGRDMRPIAEVAVAALWPLICQAREQHQRDLLNLRAQLEAEHEEMQERAYEDGKAEGRRDAAEAIEAVAQAHRLDAQDLRAHNNPAASLIDADRYEDAARVARGAQQPDEKERTDGQ